MALSGTRLKAALKSDILTQLQAQYPVPGNLTGAEQSAMAAAQTKLANAIGEGTGPDVVTEITANATVPVPGITAGGATATGTVA